MAKFTYSSKTNLFVDDFETDREAVDVYGLKGVVQTVAVGISDFDHGFANDVDMLLVGPDGQRNLVIMSDAGGPNGYGGFNFSFSDAGAAPMGDAITSGAVYKPTDKSPTETASNWGLDIPTINHPAGATFASSFGGINGNGEWALYMHDDAPGDFGGVTRWNLSVTTGEAFAALVGTDGDDVIRVTSINAYAAEGVFEINERGGVFYQGVFDFSEEGGAGNDLIATGVGVDRIFGGTGRDSVHAGGGIDYIYIGEGEDEAAEVYDGGSSDDALIHTSYGLLNLRDDTLQSIESVRLEAGGKVMLTAAQASALKSVSGDNDITHPDEFAVMMGASTAVNLAVLKFNFFDHAGDVVTIKGDTDSETILGSNVNDIIKAAGGADRIVTNFGRDIVDGGKGADAIDYSARNVSIKVTLNGSSAVNVSVDGVVEDSIRNIEDVRGGSAADLLKGDKLANTLFGLAGTDKLKGFAGNDEISGGLGADTVWGGAGEDAFIFSTPLDAVDHIKDFSHADDTIVLDNAVFAAFAKTGLIKANKFVANASGHDAHTAKQKLIYDKADHSLWYDADGNGAGAAVEIAIFDNKIKNLDHHDFLIV